MIPSLQILSREITKTKSYSPINLLSIDFQNKEYKGERCTQDIRYNFTDEKRCIKDVKEKETTRKPQLPEFAEILRLRMPTDEEIKEAIGKWKEKIMILQWEITLGNFMYFEGQQKGTQRYNKRMESLIKDVLTAFTCADRETVALTLTCDPSLANNNRFDSWKRYTKDINKTLEHLRKHHNALYLWIKESTKNGYPHAHVVLSFPKGTIDGYENMKNRQHIKYGKFYRRVKDTVISPIFHLEKVSGKNLKYYLSKYISKGTTQSFFDMAEPEFSFSDSDRKMALCTLCTICTGTRQMGKTINRKIIKEIPNLPVETLRGLGGLELKETLCPPEMAEEAGEKYDFAQDVQDLCNPLFSEEENFPKARRLRRFLIQICNNSPLSCQKSIRMMNRKRFEDEKLPDFQSIEQKDSKTHEKFKEKSKQMGCTGCYFSHLANLITTGNDSAFDFIEWGEDGIPRHLFRKEIQDNDLEFMTSVCKAIYFYTGGCFQNGNSYRNIKQTIFINKKPEIAKNRKSSESVDVKELARLALGR